jgi:hypothetical protein
MDRNRWKDRRAFPAVLFLGARKSVHLVLRALSLSLCPSKYLFDVSLSRFGHTFSKTTPGDSPLSRPTISIVESPATMSRNRRRANATLKDGPWCLVWSEQYPMRATAMQRERQIQRMQQCLGFICAPGRGKLTVWPPILPAWAKPRDSLFVAGTVDGAAW